MLRQFNNFFAPVTDKPADGGKELGKEDIISFLADDDKEEVIDLGDKKVKIKEDKEEKEEKEDKEEEEPEIDELEALEEELEEPSEEQLELTTPVRRQEILKKYPNIFKDFPYLEKAYYREQQFTELLPTIEDARKAVEDAQTLSHVEHDLMEGNTEKLLLAAKSESPKAFNKIVDNYMATLYKVDEKAHNHVIGNTIKHTIVAMVQEGRKSNNEALQTAAQILNQFIFGSSDFVPPSNLNKEEKIDESKTQVDNERQQWINEKFESAKDDLNSRVNNTLKATIEQNIDPKDSMGAYVKKNASREALESISNLIDKDSRFKILIDKLWENAKQNRFNKESTDRIRSAYLSKAKTLLPTVIKSARNEALKGIGKRVRDDDNEPEGKESSSKQMGKSTPKTHDSGKVEKGKIPAGMSSREYLMLDD